LKKSEKTDENNKKEEGFHADRSRREVKKIPELRMRSRVCNRKETQTKGKI